MYVSQVALKGPFKKLITVEYKNNISSNCTRDV